MTCCGPSSVCPPEPHLAVPRSGAYTTRSERGQETYHAAQMELYLNGRIVTCNPAQRFAAALAVRDGRIVAVGEEAAVRSAVAPDATTVDLGRRTMVPGFIDAHNHMACTAETFFAVDASPRSAASVGELVVAVAE